MLDYIKRVLRSDILGETDDYAFHEFCLVHMKDINAKINSAMSSSTYYFSYAAGVKNKNFAKKRETLLEPQRTSSKAMGFDLEIENNLSFTEEAKRTKQRPEGEGVGIVDRVMMTLKVLSNVVSINNKTFFENFTLLRCPAQYLNNLFNPKMNNIESLDYAQKDLTHDSDMILSRWTSEYPKFSSDYTDKLSQNKPWGPKSEPIFFDN